MEFIRGLIAQARQECGDPMALIEQRIDFSKYVPSDFGIGDCVIIADGKRVSKKTVGYTLQYLIFINDIY